MLQPMKDVGTDGLLFNRKILSFCLETKPISECPVRDLVLPLVPKEMMEEKRQIEKKILAGA